MADIIRELEKEQLRTDLPKLLVGDLVRVFVKVVEGDKERLQAFEGTIIRKKNGGNLRFFVVSNQCTLRFEIGIFSLSFRPFRR